MGWRQQVHGNVLQFDKSHLYLFNRIVSDTSNNQYDQIIYVNSAIAGTDGSSPSGALATLDAAINKLISGNKMKIEVMPGHAENVATASGIDFDGDDIVVQGHGTGSSMPTFTFTATAGTIEFNALNIEIYGLHLKASVPNIVKGIDIKNGADDYVIAGCRFSTDTLGTDEFIDTIFITTSDRGKIYSNYIDMDEGAAASAIHFVGACLGADTYSNYITGDYSVANIESVTAAQEQLVFKNNTLINGVHSGLNTVGCINLRTGTSAFFQGNKLYTNVTAAVTAAVVADGGFFGGGNTVTTSAETASIELEGGASVLIRSSVATGKADEADNEGLFTVVGNIYVHGITQRAEVASSANVLLGVQVDATDTTLDSVLVTDTDVSTETSVGDYAVSAAAGGAFSVIQVENTTASVMWDTPVLVPAGIIEQAASGTPGNLVSGYIIYWSEATAGATCVAI